MPEFRQSRMDRERLIVTKIVDDALAFGHKISVNDGEEYVVKLSRDRSAILEALASTDQDVIHFHNADDDKRFGWVSLVWGNDCDIISDYLVNARTEACLAGAQELANELDE